MIYFAKEGARGAYKAPVDMRPSRLLTHTTPSWRPTPPFDTLHTFRMDQFSKVEQQEKKGVTLFA